MRRLTGLLLLLISGSAFAHEVRPAYLQITANEHGYRVLWKQPLIGENAVRLIPHLSGGAIEREADVTQLQGDSALRLWNVAGDPVALEGQSITIEGLDRTITDVFVRVQLVSGREIQRVIKPAAPSAPISDSEHADVDVTGYLSLGVEHILTGYDHLLFVLGLVLLVRRAGTLIKTITAFTVAHSITLAATALNLIHPISAVVETLVALSIVLLAVELTKSYRGEPGLTARYPWAIAFAFGLLHGAAFAGALLDVGLPHSDVPLALFLFNVGVEAGQLIFIGAALLTLELIRRIPLRRPEWMRFVPAYAIGGLAAAWTFERLAIAFP
jgi:hydrogenase/urease accessory protein HupE